MPTISGATLDDVDSPSSAINTNGAAAIPRIAKVAGRYRLAGWLRQAASGILSAGNRRKLGHPQRGSLLDRRRLYRSRAGRAGIVLEDPLPVHREIGSA